MKILLILVIALLALIALVVAVGWCLPVKHVATRSVRLRASGEKVWRAISDFPAAAAWRSDLKAVEQVETSPGVFAWREISKGGDALTYSTLEASPDTKLVRKIIDQGIPFGGSWIFTLQREGDATVLTITEDGEVYHPIFRFMARFVFGHHATMDRYLKDLQKHLGE